MPAGAEVVSAGVHFRVWAPEHKAVEVILYQGDSERPYPLHRENTGYFSALVRDAAAGARYKFRLDSGNAYPDPASRFQPDGPHHASQVIDPSTFKWTDSSWRGVPPTGQVIYEMHFGTFTEEGTYAAAVEKLEFLRDTGITLLEVMPLSEFPGRFGWGYDGVHPFAPTHLYGAPDDFRAFVDRAHSLGLGVILDVVYNHLGPDGNYFGEFSKHYFSTRYNTDWGPAFNFDGEHCDGAREMVISNAVYWISEFHLDGLRLDATQDIYDSSSDHILAALSRSARAVAASKPILLIAENEPQQTRLVRPQDRGGHGLDMLWNDDYHHSAMVALSGHNEAYYSDHNGSPQEFISAAKYGYLFQGQWYKWQKKRRGAPAFDIPPHAFVTFTQNHDQIANSARGLRMHALADRGVYKAITALTLLSPGTPMLFQGQEFAASSPFYYFADHVPQLGAKVRQGREDFMAQFPTLGTAEMEECLPDPGKMQTFQDSKVSWADLEKNEWVHRMHRDLLRLRRETPVLNAQRPRSVDGAVLSDSAFILRFFGDRSSDRLLVVNLGRDLNLDPAPEPLLAPPENLAWDIEWSSENPGYGGCGTPPIETQQNWWIPGRAAILLKPGPRHEDLPEGRVNKDAE
jgi:maltooligosyltrehalose trehalohydrolase